MSQLREWLTRVLTHGESVQAVRPTPAGTDRVACRPELRAAFDRHALRVAGPPLPFAEDAAWHAAEFLAAACWQLVGDDDPPPPLPPFPREPATAAAHLSADVTLRLLPAVLRRARAKGDGDLSDGVEAALRRWPLSGVLADLDAPPLGPLDFVGHAGLQLLYAERLAAAPRAAWVPPDGPAREWAERVFAERGRPLTAPPIPTPTEEPRD